MTADEFVRNALRQLSDELDADLATLERIHRDVLEEMPKTAGVSPDRRVLAFLALQVDRYYTAAESALQRIVRVFDHTPSSGADWHRQLLDQVAVEAPNLRPAVLETDSLGVLDGLRQFRHFLRHAYAAELVWERMQSTVETLVQGHDGVIRDMGAFRGFVKQCLDEARP
jgi:hypothetical protein